MGKIIDLDVLRPEPVYIKLNKYKIDVSYIPCAITQEIDDLVRDIGTIDQKKIKDEMNSGKNGQEIKKAFELSIKLCVEFCRWKYPELDYEWFLENLDAIQVSTFAEAIKEALIKSYAGVNQYGKNQKASQ